MHLHRNISVSTLAIAIALLLFAAACGSDNNNASNNPGGTNNGGSNPGSSNPGNNGSGSSTYYLAALLSNDNSTNRGQITLDANRGGNVQLHNVPASTQYTINFCQFPNGTTNCIAVGTVNSDAAGNVSSAFTFSQSGTWVGVFNVMPTNGGVGYNSTFPTTGQQFQSPVVQAGAVTDGLPSIWQPVGSDPLTSGNVVVNNGVAHFTLQGAAPSTSYNVGYCANGAGSSCFGDLGTISTDASGNGSGDIQTNNYNAPGVFDIGRNGAVQFVTGIRVP